MFVMREKRHTKKSYTTETQVRKSTKRSGIIFEHAKPNSETRYGESTTLFKFHNDCRRVWRNVNQKLQSEKFYFGN